jgi:hypothetical protein
LAIAPQGKKQSQTVRSGNKRDRHGGQCEKQKPKIFSTVAVGKSKTTDIIFSNGFAFAHCHTKGFVFFTVPECLARLFAQGHKQKVLAHRLTLGHAEGWQARVGMCVGRAVGGFV